MRNTQKENQRQGKQSNSNSGNNKESDNYRDPITVWLGQMVGTASGQAETMVIRGTTQLIHKDRSRRGLSKD